MQTQKLERLLLKYVDKYKGMPIALSGGVDSSLLAALIKPKFAITVELPGGDTYNEVDQAKKVADYLNIKHIIVKVDDSKWDEYMERAVKAIGRPIPHFNIFPLFFMYKKLAEMGERTLVLGDGPDETMCGYTRDLIINYLYNAYKIEAFASHHQLLDKLLPSINEAICIATDKPDYYQSITQADIDLMRPDMDDMSNGLAKYFNIVNLRPYQDNQEIDDFMFNLPIEEKIHKNEYGKYTLRKVADKYLPKDIAWNKRKRGGPVYPVNKMRNWMALGEFDKQFYLEYQEKILYGKN